jgi:hypothetical protein
MKCQIPTEPRAMRSATQIYTGRHASPKMDARSITPPPTWKRTQHSHHTMTITIDFTMDSEPTTMAQTTGQTTPPKPATRDHGMDPTRNARTPRTTRSRIINGYATTDTLFRQNPEKYSRSAPSNSTPHPGKSDQNSRPNSTPPTAHGGTHRLPDNRPDSYRPASQLYPDRYRPRKRRMDRPLYTIPSRRESTNSYWKTSSTTNSSTTASCKPPNQPPNEPQQAQVDRMVDELMPTLGLPPFAPLPRPKSVRFQENTTQWIPTSSEWRDLLKFRMPVPTKSTRERE